MEICYRGFEDLPLYRVDRNSPPELKKRSILHSERAEEVLLSIPFLPSEEIYRLLSAVGISDGQLRKFSC